jgi:MFS family permease
LSTKEVFWLTSVRERALSAASQAGLVNNLNDGLAWGIFPLFFARAGLSVSRIGILAALYPAVWGVGQLVTGALSDRVGRKWLIAGGMWLQAVAIAFIAAVHGFSPWAFGALLLGAGTAMVYPTLLAAIGDVAHPAWRARSVGVYRLWRDAGFAIGAIVAGVVADALGLRSAIWFVGGLTALSGVVVALRMYETHPTRRRARRYGRRSGPCGGDERSLAENETGKRPGSQTKRRDRIWQQMTRSWWARPMALMTPNPC